MKKKGFTLIELLAVIVILAIIALITVPVVIKIINNSKKGAAEDSAYGVVEAAKLFWMSNQVDFVNNNSDVTFTCGSNGECTSTFTGTTTALEISGTKPTSGSVKIKNGAISVINLQFGEYYCNKAKTEEKISCGTNEAEVPQEDLTYTISFETDGGTIMLPKVVEPGETLGTVSNPRKIGYTFTGWIDGESNPVTSSTPITSDITLYAQYEIKNVTVTFNSDGGSSVDSITFQEGSMIDPLPETTKAGNNFLGWFNGQEQLTTSKMIMNDTTYTAHWEERTVTVTFNSDGGSSVSPRTIPEGSTISDLPTSTKLGYTLTAWKNGSNTLTTSTVINSDITYTAEWAVKNVTVTFDTAGGSSVDSITFQEGSTISTLPTTTKSGVEFLGWYDANENLLTTSTIIMTDIVYYARWKNANFSFNSSNPSPIKYTIPYTGTYKLEVWGAQGGSSSNPYYIGGYGGYSVGEKQFKAGEEIYVVIGGQGKSGTATLSQNYGDGGYNGGGSRSGYNCSNCVYYSSSGGGATHIATESGLLSEFSSSSDQAKVLIVAGGGGGNGYTDGGWNVNSTNNASGGGKIGNKGNSDNVHNSATLASQDTGYAIGQGQNCGSSGVCDGGGAGWYGGYTGTSGASGGSGYLKSTLTNKSMYCYNCQEDNNPNTYTVSTYGETTHASERDTTNCPNGYSEDPVSKCAKAGNGYARITYLGN